MFYESVLFTVTLVEQGIVDLAATTLYLSAWYLIRYGQFETLVITVFLSFITESTGKNHKWYTDNYNVITIVSKGITKSVLLGLILEICLYTILTLVWIRRSDNDITDCPR